MIFYTTGISYINPLFQAPKPLKPFKSRPRDQNLPGEPLIAHSDHRGPLSDPIYPQKCCFFDLFTPFLNFLWFIYMTSISYINPYFRAPSPLKPLKSNSRYQNLPGEPLTAHSDPKNDRKLPKSAKKRPKIDLCFIRMIAILLLVLLLMLAFLVQI